MYYFFGLVHGSGANGTSSWADRDRRSQSSVSSRTKSSGSVVLSSDSKVLIDTVPKFDRNFVCALSLSLSVCLSVSRQAASDTTPSPIAIIAKEGCTFYGFSLEISIGLGTTSRNN
jgi:hypothetical protein